MSNPITSVPEPSASGSSALASVITQVQPGQVPVGVRRGPVRPVKVTGSQADGTKKRKKKKKRAANAVASGDAANQNQTVVMVASGSPSTVAEAAESGAGAASAQSATQGGSDLTSTKAAAQADSRAEVQAQDLEVTDAERDREQTTEHSYQPSSTIIGDASAGNTMNSSVTAPLALLDLDKSADKVASESSEGSVEKDAELVRKDTLLTASGDEKGRGASGDLKRPSLNSRDKVTVPPPVNVSASGPESEKPAAAKARAPLRPRKKQKPASLKQKFLAFLTCSSGAAVMAAEDVGEKTSIRNAQRQGQGARLDSTKQGTQNLSPPRTPNPKTSGVNGDAVLPSKTGTSPGGGTRLPKEETGDVMSGAVVPPGSSFVNHEALKAGASSKGADASLDGQSSSEDDEEDDGEDDDDEDDEEDDEEDEDEEDEDIDGDYLDDDQTEEQRLIMQGGMGIPRDEYGNLQPLLVPIIDEDAGRKCLVLDLDETLVHSSFKMIQNADFIVPVEIEGTVHNVYVIKRPGVDEFMRKMGEIYEVVVFTASLSKYADPVLDMLDIHRVVRHRLFRESCYNHKGNYVKDLSQLGRDISETIIIDNSPASYIFHPNNAVPISSWFNDPHDTELTDLCPFLADLCEVDDVRAVLDGGL